jgi:hypothetical protein
VSNRRISFSQHINKSVKSSSHARRVTLADLTPGISTPEEHALWEYLYSMHTNGTRTQWIAFTAEWNGIADVHARSGSKAIMHKRIDQLQKYQQQQVRNILSRTDASAGPFMQAGQPPQQQQQAMAGGGVDTLAAAAAAAGTAAAVAGFGYPGVGHFYLYQQQVHPGMFPLGAGQFGQPMYNQGMGAAAGHGFGMGGMFDPTTAAAAAAAGAGGAGPGLYDPAAAAAKRSQWAASRGERQAPPKADKDPQGAQVQQVLGPTQREQQGTQERQGRLGAGVALPVQVCGLRPAHAYARGTLRRPRSKARVNALGWAGVGARSLLVSGDIWPLDVIC